MEIWNTGHGKVESTGQLLKQSISDNSAVGSVDLWRNFLAIGTPDLKLVNLDSSRTLLKSNEVRYTYCPPWTIVNVLRL